MNQTHHTFETWERALAAISEERQKYALCKKVLYHLNINKVYLDSTLSLTKFSSIVGTNISWQDTSKALGDTEPGASWFVRRSRCLLLPIARAGLTRGRGLG